MSSIESNANNKKIAINWTLLISIVGLVLGSGLIWTIYDRFKPVVPPKFTISAIYTLGGEQSKTYEITNHFINVGPTDGITLTWGLEVIPDYSGDESYGEVHVRVKNSRGKIVAEDKWKDFSKESKKLDVALDPYKLSSEVERIDFRGLQENIFEVKNIKFPETTFNIEIFQVSRPNSPLLTDKLTVRNAPWYHYTAVSALHNNSIDIFVYGKNLGGASDFYVIGNIFEIAKIPGSAHHEWPWVDYQQILITDVDPEEEFTAKLTFPKKPEFKFEFEKGKVYLVETYLIKKQNYVEFSDGGWDSAANKWKMGSFSTLHLLQP